MTGEEKEGGKERQFVKDLREGDQVEGTFAVRKKEAPRDYRQRTGKYFFMDVGDRTGDIGLKFWGGDDPALTVEIYKSIRVGDVISITGTVIMDRYDECLVIKLDEGTNDIRPVTSEIRFEDYLPVSPQDLDALMERVLSTVSSVKDPHLKALLDSFFGDEAFVKEFKRTPSAVVHHHNYIGGNIEHVVGVLEICETMCKVHKELDRDLLVTGALLHDIGKMRTYVYGTSIDMSDEGRFISHALLGERMVAEAIDKLEGFPKELAMKLGHMIIKHMGRFEDIGVTGMRTLEALALHLADNVDAQVKEYAQEIERGRELEPGNWHYSRTFKGPIYLK
jgi:3'-5' exoribonuclease